MKFSNGNIVLTLLALLVSSASAEEILLAVRSLLLAGTNISATEKQAINSAMNVISTELDILVQEVIGNATVPSARKLRINDDRKLNCSPCTYYPSYYTGCWVNGIWRDRCRRALTMHEDLSEAAIAELSEEDRRRHLQISTLCQEAKAEVTSTIHDATSEGVVPLPEGATFVEQCFYEIA